MSGNLYQPALSKVTVHKKPALLPANRVSRPRMSTIVEVGTIRPFEPVSLVSHRDIVHERRQWPGTASPGPDGRSLRQDTEPITTICNASPKTINPPAWQATQNALTVAKDRTYQVVKDFPAPQALAAHEVLIRTHAVGLNHIDWKSVDFNYCLPDFPWVTGREMAGIVERVGQGVKEVRVGERVWTSE